MGSSSLSTSTSTSSRHNHHCYALTMVIIIAVTALICSAIQCVAIVDRMVSVISWNMEDETMFATIVDTTAVAATPIIETESSNHDSSSIHQFLRSAAATTTKSSSSLPPSSPPAVVVSSVSQESIHTTSTSTLFSDTSGSYSEKSINNDNEYHPIQSLLDDGKKVVLFELSSGSSHGLGSSMIWILLFQIYFQDVSNGRRLLVLDERKTTSYRTNMTHGAYSGGIFMTSFPVLDSLSIDMNSIDYQWQQQMNVSTNPTQYNEQLIDEIKIRQEDTLEFIQGRKMVHEKYNTNNYLNELLLFEKLSFTLCKNIRINPHLLRNDIQSILNASNIPNFDITTTTTTTTVVAAANTTNRTLSSSSTIASSSSPSNPITVAFHIRRGDKLKLESRAYRGFEYVHTLKKALKVVDGDNDQSILANIQYCFVATDDYNAVVELQQALTNNNIHCTLYTLMSTPDTTTNRNTDGTIQFLAELKVLVDATYFIGTFNSNVGNLVALYRGCSRRIPKRRDEEITEMDIYRKFQHYYNSYGVDSNEWGRSLYIY